MRPEVRGSGGFSFKGVHSSTFGVYETPNSQSLLPEKRRSLIEIPGRSESFIQEDGGYNSRVESISCSYIPKIGENLQRQVRLIAGWLSGIGELTFDYEPEMHYNAFLSSAPPVVKQLAMEYATFELDFTINHPFAYENVSQLNFESIASGSPITVKTDGTISTPFRIVIKNVGDKPIHNLIITQKFNN